MGLLGTQQKKTIGELNSDFQDSLAISKQD